MPSRSVDDVTSFRRVAVIAPGLDILGGQGIQAAALVEALRGEGFEIDFIPMNPTFPGGLRWLRKLPYLRTLLNQVLYRWSLKRIARVDIVHLFSASYWSFLLAQVPAIKASRQYGKPVILNYHSGEADDHLRNWGKRVHPWLAMVNRIVVPSVYLKQVIA
ncbi:MAG: glycosyltransferase family 4 protein, partial [Pseudohongiella sp.]